MDKWDAAAATEAEGGVGGHVPKEVLKNQTSGGYFRLFTWFQDARFSPKQRNVRSFNLPPHVSDRQTQDNSHIRCEAKKHGKLFCSSTEMCGEAASSTLKLLCFSSPSISHPPFCFSSIQPAIPHALSRKFDNSPSFLFMLFVLLLLLLYTLLKKPAFSGNAIFAGFWTAVYKVITCGKGGRVQFFPMGAGSRRHLKFIHPRWNDEEGGKKRSLWSIGGPFC